MKKVNLTLMAFLMGGAALFTGWEKRERKSIKPINLKKLNAQHDEDLGFEKLCFRLDNMLKPYTGQ